MSTKVTGIIAKVFQYGIAIVGTFFFFMILSGNDPGGVYISKAINLSLWAIYIAAGIAVLFGIYQFAINIKNNKKGLIGIVAFIAIIFGANAMAKKQTVTEAMLSEGITTQDLIMTDTGLYTFYALITIAILAIIFSEISRIFK
jgi:hypothetical protein